MFLGRYLFKLCLRHPSSILVTLLSSLYWSTQFRNLMYAKVRMHQPAHPSGYRQGRLSTMDRTLSSKALTFLTCLCQIARITSRLSNLDCSNPQCRSSWVFTQFHPTIRGHQQCSWASSAHLSTIRLQRSSLASMPVISINRCQGQLM